MECYADGGRGAQVIYGYEVLREARVAPLHRGVRGRLPPARAGYGLDWGGSRQGKPLLDVAGLFLVFFLITLFNLPLVFLYACLEV